MRLSLVAVLTALLVSCGHTKDPEYKISPVLAMAPPAASVAYELAAEPESDGPSYSGDLILKSAQVRFQADSVEKTTRVIETLVSKTGGIIVDQNLTTASNEIGNRIVIRVPAAVFEKLLDDLCKESLFVNYKRISSQNVTEEFHDIQARLKTKKEVRDRYTEILKTRAKSVEDILKAEEHIRVLQEEIESREGRLKFLQSRVSMSEISLEIYQKVVYKESPTLVEKSFSAKVTEALAHGSDLITTSVLFIISGWPVLLAGLLMMLAWRRLRRRIRTQESI